MGYDLGRRRRGPVRVLRRLGRRDRSVTAELLPRCRRPRVDRARPDPGRARRAGPGRGGGGPGRWRWWHPAAVEPPPQVASDFWFEFDDQFAFNPPPEVAAILGQPGLMDLPHQELDGEPAGRARSRLLSSPPSRRSAASLEAISRHQLEVMDRYYPGDIAGLQDAFELFG